MLNLMNVLAVFNEKSTVQSSAIYEIIYLMKRIWIFNWIKNYSLSLVLEIEVTFYLSTIPFVSQISILKSL